MSELPLEQHLPGVSRLALGCMGLGGAWDESPVSAENLIQAEAAVEAALDAGINFFDHADIYTLGKAEKAFGEVLKAWSGLRERIFIQSKCAIRFGDDEGPDRYDFSKQWIRKSVEGSLSRLCVDYLDVLLLHRPDPLMEVDEVAEVLSALKEEGKVKAFGVSNMHSYQIERLQRALDFPLVVNQLEMGLHQLAWLDEGLYAGNSFAPNCAYSAGTMEYCDAKEVQLQSWGSLSQGLFSGKDVSGATPNVQAAALLVGQLAEKYSVSREALILAWLMRHPVGIQPIIGTTNAKRILACGDAVKVSLSREDWWALYVSARGQKIP